MSPVSNWWLLTVIVFVSVLTPVELNPIWFISSFPVALFLETLTDVDVPIPTERFGFTVSSTTSFTGTDFRISMRYLGNGPASRES